MSDTLTAAPVEKEAFTVRLSPDLIEWLHESAKKSGLSPDQIVAASLAAARAKLESPNPFNKLSGVVKGLPSDLSSRKGFDRGDR